MKHSIGAITAEGGSLFAALNRRFNTKAAHAEQIGTCLTLLREVA